MTTPPLYCALLHHPVCDRTGMEVTTSVSNMDVHDIARSARTYGLAGYFVVSPIEAQRPIVERIVTHWAQGAGATRLPDRSEALRRVRFATSLEAVLATLHQTHGSRARVLATSATPPAGHPLLAFGDARAWCRQSSQPVLLLFGTGHGLAPRVLAAADALLAPIEGPGDYNHLSVRAAAAIIFDRIFGASSREPRDAGHS